ncbi:MAG: hypothetical protein RIE56_11715 [Amphiplicatus sp.]
MGQKVIWVCAILVLAAPVLSAALGIATTLQTLTLFTPVDPQILAGAVSEGLINFLLGLPFVLAQVILAIWAIKQLRKQKTVDSVNQVTQ